MTDQTTTDEDSIDDATDDGFTFPRSLRGEGEPGARLGSAIADAVGTFVGNLLLLVSRLTPGSQRMWHGLLKLSYKGLLKKSGADAIMHVSEEGHLRHKPVAYKRELEAHDEIENPRWITQDGEWWHANDGARATTLKGRVPTLWASANSTEVGTDIQADVAEVLDLGDGKTLTETAVVNKQMIQMPGDAEGNGQAVADGGMARESAEEYVSVADPGSLKDYLVPLDKALDARDSGRVVSMDKYYETYPSTIEPEKMKEQQMYGRLQERDPGADRSFVLKVMLIAAGIIAAITLGPPLINALIGGGGSGGSVVPLAMGLLGA